jgi:hypothetical protein
VHGAPLAKCPQAHLRLLFLRDDPAFRIHEYPVAVAVLA